MRIIPPAERDAAMATMRQLQDGLDANNLAYRQREIDRDQWVARNRELAEQAKPLGLTLPPFALGN